ncbi:MAG: HigA family addiction module antidote protein [Gammaproteobacteria bacterium]|nr:HigA family addiction module antidote protein [Gammaproteobacteria bacterium]MYH85386.1 HigA family addiction module antidote protein [Gammaproteobacteria bacterium]MYK04395.1 HigA family addiction module antidote protein [Gammaproteobacteria bacterium]
MLMHDPPHPGAVIKRQCLLPLGLTVTEAAQGLAVSRNTLSMLLNGRIGISPEMAIRLSQAFGGSAESWLRQQMQYDLWQARQNRGQIEIRKFASAEAIVETGARAT